MDRMILSLSIGTIIGLLLVEGLFLELSARRKLQLMRTVEGRVETPHLPESYPLARQPQPFAREVLSLHDEVDTHRCRVESLQVVDASKTVVTCGGREFMLDAHAFKQICRQELIEAADRTEYPADPTLNRLRQTDQASFKLRFNELVEESMIPEYYRQFERFWTDRHKTLSDIVDELESIFDEDTSLLVTDPNFTPLLAEFFMVEISSMRRLNTQMGAINLSLNRLLDFDVFGDNELGLFRINNDFVSSMNTMRNSIGNIVLHGEAFKDVNIMALPHLKGLDNLLVAISNEYAIQLSAISNVYTVVLNDLMHQMLSELQRFQLDIMRDPAKGMMQRLFLYGELLQASNRFNNVISIVIDALKKGHQDLVSQNVTMSQSYDTAPQAFLHAEQRLLHTIHSLRVFQQQELEGFMANVRHKREVKGFCKAQYVSLKQLVMIAQIMGKTVKVQYLEPADALVGIEY